MTTELTGKQLDFISDALLDGIATVDELRRYVKISLDNDLDEIAMGDDLRDITFKVVEWSERHGCVGNLIEFACSETPQNQMSQKLSAFWRDLQLPPQPTARAAEAAGAAAPAAAVPPAVPQALGRRRARVIIEGDDTTVVLGGPGPNRPPAAPSAAPSAAPAPGLRTAAPARSKLYLRVIAALLLAALVLLAFMLGRTFTNPPPAPVPAAAVPAPSRISLSPGPLSALSTPHL